MSLRLMLVPVLLLASLFALFGALLLGSTPMAAPRVLAALAGLADAADSVVIWQVRLPRALAAFGVGLALGGSGAALQGLLRNPLAEPGVLGVSASASLGAAFALYYGFFSVSAWLVPIASVAGALLASLLIAAAAIRTSSVVTLILDRVRAVEFRRRRHEPADESRAQSLLPVRHDQLDARLGWQIAVSPISHSPRRLLPSA